MKRLEKNIWIMIQSDPKSSHRVCEGMRIALGLAASGHDVSILLAKKAVDMLCGERDAYIDEDLLEKLWPTIIDYIPVFYIYRQGLKSEIPQLFEYKTQFLSEEDIGKKLGEADVFFRF